MSFKQKLPVSLAVLVTAVSVLAATMILGREARLVEVVTLFAGGFASGAAVTSALATTRSARRRMSTGGGPDVDRVGPREA